MRVRPQRAAWLVIAAGALLAAIGVLFLPPILVNNDITETDWTMWVAGILVMMSGVGFYSVRLSKPLYTPLACVMFILLTVLLTSALPIANQHMQGALYRFSVYARETAQRDEKIISYGINNPSIVFYSDHKVANIRGRDSLMTHVKEKKDRIAIARPRDEDVMKEAGFTLLKKEGGYALFERD